MEGPGAPGHPPALAQCGSIWRGLRVPSWGFPLRPGGAVLPQTHISTSWLPQNSPRSPPPLRCGDPDPFTETWGGPALPASLAPSQPYTFCPLPKFLTLQFSPPPDPPLQPGPAPTLNWPLRIAHPLCPPPAPDGLLEAGSLSPPPRLSQASLIAGCSRAGIGKRTRSRAWTRGPRSALPGAPPGGAVPAPAPVPLQACGSAGQAGVLAAEGRSGNAKRG